MAHTPRSGRHKALVAPFLAARRTAAAGIGSTPPPGAHFLPPMQRGWLRQHSFDAGRMGYLLIDFSISSMTRRVMFPPMRPASREGDVAVVTLFQVHADLVGHSYFMLPSACLFLLELLVRVPELCMIVFTPSYKFVCLWSVSCWSR